MKIQAHHRWVGMIVGLLGMSFVIQFTALWLANSDPSFAVVEDYERKAHDWDDFQAQVAHNAELGWRADLRTSPLARGVEVVLTLTDGEGAAIEGAEVALVAFHNARAGEKLRVALPHISGSRYGMALPLQRAGLWEFQLEVRSGDDLFTDTIRKSVAVGG
ncbi:FixH family protein [Engelhardtia mirabilis]|uniref:FixH n=1 Tax=Engelhardtia mirabilis TaxID=2528011 RepID=A0A518BIJ5_9BACT|nr:FixH [Planctomycetes bacterium Pla133]QDV01112.1 FixH [Planctomycetes bacterium Pla86]